MNSLSLRLGMSWFWVERVVPFAVEVVAGQDPFGFKVFHLLVGDLDACGIGRPVEFGVHGQPGVGGGRGDRLDEITSWLVNGLPRQLMGTVAGERIDARPCSTCWCPAAGGTR